MRRNPIVNSGDGSGINERVSYYTNNGTPYTVINQPTDLRTADKIAQPRDNNFLVKDASGAKTNGDHIVGTGVFPAWDPVRAYAVGDRITFFNEFGTRNVSYECITAIPAGSSGTPNTWNAADWRVFTGPGNILWDNEEGKMHYNTGQGIGHVKVTNFPSRYQSYSPLPQDIPFIQYGASNQSVNGRRLNGVARPQTARRALHMRDVVGHVTEWELADPRNPFVAKVKSQEVVSQFFPLEQVDQFIVAGPARKPQRGFQNIPLDRSFERASSPQNEVMSQMPYTQTDMTHKHPFIQGITKHMDERTVTITPVMSNAGTNTMTINWGDGTADTTGVTSGTAVPHTYAANGVYDITITNNATVGTLFNPATAYNINDRVVFGDRIYAARRGVQTGPFNPLHWAVIGWIQPTDVQVLKNNFVRDSSWAPTELAWDAAFEANPMPWTIGHYISGTFAPNPIGRTIKIDDFTVTGSPFQVLSIDWGDRDTNRPGDFQRVFPKGHTMTESTFDLSHTYLRPGTYLVRIIVEHSIDDFPYTTNLYGSNNMPTQSRRQMVIIKPVTIQ